MSDDELYREQKHDPATLSLAIARKEQRENSRNVTTRSQTKLVDAEDRVKKTQSEIRTISEELFKNRQAIQQLAQVIAAQELNLADLQADERADLQLIHQLRMDGVSLP